MHPKKELGPKSLGEAFTKVAKSLGGWWISGIVLTIIFAVIFKFWTNTNLVPLLFLIGIATRIYPVNFPIHRMLEIVTISTIIIVLKFNPFIGAVFGFSVFIISRFFGHVEAPDLTILLGVSTVIMAYLVPILQQSYSLVYLIIILSAIRVVIITGTQFLIMRKVTFFISDLGASLLVSCGLNYLLVTFLLTMGWI